MDRSRRARYSGHTSRYAAPEKASSTLLEYIELDDNLCFTGTSADTTNYVSFLTVLRAAMPFGTTISVCAPASFWYLQGFEIQAMAPLVDYVVFMTYDIHGQWDYGNAYSDDGCPLGNCLRSDVNLTETLLALSMITKAGVPSNQIVVGVTSYGRSFQMTTAGCYTADCTYTGANSGAFAGPCTQTEGYIADAEINSILAGTGTVLSADGSPMAVTGTPFSYFDNNSYSNIAVYDGTQWVGYMDNSNKADRVSLYQTYNFAGTADWAIDLQNFTGDTGGTSGSEIIFLDPSIWTEPNPDITCEPPCILVLPPYPLGSTQTVSWPELTTTLLSSSADGSVYVVTTTIDVPAFTITDVSLQPITILPTDTGTYVLDPVQSITPSSFIITLPPYEATFPPTTPTPVATTSTTTSGTAVLGLIPPGVVFYPTPVPVTIQPQPSFSVSFPPPPTPMPAVTISNGPNPTPTTCTGSGCGSRNCGIFGCEPGCGLFGCNGGCGIFGCGGGCGILGCFGDCPLDLCGGLGCLIPGGCGNTQGPDGGDDSNDCDEPATASACTYVVSSYSSPPMAEYSTTTSVCVVLFLS
jgi:chitinase